MSLKAALRRTSAWRNFQARRLAAGPKRLDLCAAQIAHLLHLAGKSSFEDRICFEAGSGWVLTHALVFHLLGARRVIASDIEPEAQPAAARSAVLAAVPSIVRDILSPFADHEALRERIDRLRDWNDYSFAGLEKLGIAYAAPLDLATTPLPEKVDFIYSNSVLEHVPAAQADAVVSNLARCLLPGGSMVHAIHLEDHRDHARRPFDFLSVPSDRYLPAEQSSRGNRLRASSWEKIFGAIPLCRSEKLYEWRRPAALLPRPIDAGVASTGLDDARVSHLAYKTARA